MAQHITLPDPKSVLIPRMPALANALGMAFHTWVHGSPAQLAILDETARAVCISQYWYEYVRRNCSKDTQVTFHDVQNQRFVFVDDSYPIILRIKQVSDSYLSKNAPTHRSLGWNRQIQLDGIPPGFRLELGYIPDLTGTTVSRACILFRLQNNVIWHWQIWGVQDTTLASAVRPNGTNMLGDVVFTYDDFSTVPTSLLP